MSAVPEPKKITVDEFMQTTEESTLLELLDGETVAMGSPTRIHQRISVHLGRTIEDHIQQHHGACSVDVAAGARLNDHTLVIPDVMVVCDSSKLDDQYCHGAPDWVIEVLSTNRDRDLYQKLLLYRDAGVREYWIVDPKNEKTLVYFFEKSDFPDIYTFDTPVPVGIYDGALSIRIAGLL